MLLVAGAVGDELEPKVGEWGAAPGGRIPVQRLPGAELVSLVGSPDHQGIAAEVEPYPYVELGDVLGSHTLLIALDAVQDPHNLGAIIRTAEAAGAGVVIPRHRAAEITAAVVKASAGATEHAVVARVRNLADALAEAKEAGFWIYGAAADADSPHFSQDYRYPTCFVVGSEGEGVGRRVAAMCDVMVALPLLGEMESLNVSVSAGILLYEALRQRATSGGEGRASPGEGAYRRVGEVRQEERGARPQVVKRPRHRRLLHERVSHRWLQPSASDPRPSRRSAPQRV